MYFVETHRISVLQGLSSLGAGLRFLLVQAAFSEFAQMGTPPWTEGLNTG